MKYVVLVPDGAADYPVAELDGRTPLQAASTPNMDKLAREGRGGTVQMIPPSRHPGSDIGNLEIFGYDTTRHYTGRAPLEAASMGIELGDDDVAFRCNLITRDGDTLVDYSAGHISTEEGAELVKELATELEREGIRFYPGVGYRHIMVYAGGPERLQSFPPHDIMGESIVAHLPSGDGQEEIRRLMVAAEPILKAADINTRRVAGGKSPANSMWLWGSGRALKLKTLSELHGLSGAVISAVDLVRGIGKCAGYEVIEVPGITGYLDTNYAGKADYALKALEDGKDVVYVHVEAPDEAGHIGDPQAKKQALEDFDGLVVGRMLDGLGALGPCRVLLTPDHRTPIELRTHSREPVPFVLWGKNVATDGLEAYNEEDAAAGALHLERGHELITHLIEE